jgi:hypothetical protein
VSNLQGRYEVHGRERFDDGWTVPGLKKMSAPPPKTIVTDEFAKTILTRNASPDIPVQGLAQSLPRLRARLHLLLRPARRTAISACRRAWTSKAASSPR